MTPVKRGLLFSFPSAAQDHGASGARRLRGRAHRAREHRLLRPTGPAAVRRQREHGGSGLHVRFPTGCHGMLLFQDILLDRLDFSHAVCVNCEL